MLSRAAQRRKETCLHNNIGKGILWRQLDECYTKYFETYWSESSFTKRSPYLFDKRGIPIYCLLIFFHNLLLVSVFILNWPELTLSVLWVILYEHWWVKPYITQRDKIDGQTAVTTMDMLYKQQNGHALQATKWTCSTSNKIHIKKCLNWAIHK